MTDLTYRRAMIAIHAVGAAVCLCGGAMLLWMEWEVIRLF